ncbi:hypothetical protein SEA_TIMOTHY_90 [Mycobacterium phage Timothy]|nr:hypothetical protein SEA_EBONY_89 [Mycobacterium phage Ebony]AXC33546.1 hypothetical protein SEA_JOSELITO_88 [Mycobacterium phage Joselito]QBI98252.1 hypothetical protein SEA_BOWTIE_86 [Mycobacterium phage Bowtie]QBI98458.1 hypothetical protein SEA_MUNCH_89 [Mycobacterium phage Munch]QGZ16505.1 hypothetical protein SEA_ANEEM_91 [Mycobacterium phage Aneem]QHJ86598.1 hypothetical protein SEA_MABEL_90 [Mycobacterium phage Mabel]UAW08960.1 hypothetical protein SEA_LUCIVIA_91 [Mycobacterium pha
MAVIQDSSYREVEGKLRMEHQVVQMSIEVATAYANDKGFFVHDDGTPRFEFMQRANTEYRRRGGTTSGHIGAVANAILANVKFIVGEAETL